jgi:Zn-dependent M28 family amino/carboxypeptidase
MRRKNRLYHVLALVLLTAFLLPAPATAAVEVPTDALRAAVTLQGVRAHQAALQAIADANNNTRASGTPGYDQSADYVKGKLEAAGYQVTLQPFTFVFFQELTPSVMEQTAPNPTVYVNGTDFLTMEYSGSGDVTALVQATNDLVLPPTPDPSSTSGCEAEDFAGFTAGNIALIQRGTCTFAEKAQNAQAAGAAGVVIFNEGNPGRTDLFGGTLGGPGVTIPVVSVSFALGVALNSGGITLHIMTDPFTENRSTVNVLADTPGGRADRRLIVGAHLDSVVEGPGINDNGSGTAAILEVALQMAALGIQPRNKVTFAFWGAEESGLLGAEYYVSTLDKKAIQDIQANLNFDMVGSVNFVRFVYDGDGSATPLAGPNGSPNIEQVFLSYFAGQGLATEATGFDGRSDYGPFIAVGIPAGGLFTGAEGLKTAEQAAIYGGTAGMAYDPCYHQACDTYDYNTNPGPGLNGDPALDQMSDAIAHSVLTFAMTTSAVNGTDKGKGSKKWEDGMTFRGSHVKK